MTGQVAGLRQVNSKTPPKDRSDRSFGRTWKGTAKTELCDRRLIERISSGVSIKVKLHGLISGEVDECPPTGRGHAFWLHG